MYYCDKPLTGPIHAPMLIIFWYDMRVINTTPTMINTFKVVSYAASGTRCDWSADQMINQAYNYKSELAARYPETVFSVEIDQQNAFSY